MALPSVPDSERDAVHACCHSALRTSTLHDATNAGQTWRKSSRSHPGNAENVEGVINGAGGGAGTGSGCACCGCGVGVGITGGGITTGGGKERGGSGVVQAANASATIPIERGKLRRANDIRTDMWILMVEAGVAFFLLVFIVWWTMYSGKKPSDHTPRVTDDKNDPPKLPRG